MYFPWVSLKKKALFRASKFVLEKRGREIQPPFKATTRLYEQRVNKLQLLL